MPLHEAEGRRDPQQDLKPEPPLEHHCKWIEWHGQCVDMPVWWQELQAILDVEDHQELTQKGRSSLKVPMVRSQAQGGKNNYSAPPAPKCIGKDRFLPPLDPWMGSQDYCLGQPRKTLACEQALLYCWERVKPPVPSKPHPLMGSILGLRQVMEPFTTFEDSEVLSYNTALWGCDVCHSCWAHPRGSFQWPTAKDNQGLVLVTSPRPRCWPLPWEKPYPNEQCTLTNPPHACQDWKRVQVSPHR